LSAAAINNINAVTIWAQSAILSPRRQAGLETKILSSDLDSASKKCSQSWPRPRAFVLKTFYFGFVKMSVMMELVIIVSLQWLSTKVIYLQLLTLCYSYKLVQVHSSI